MIRLLTYWTLVIGFQVLVLNHLDISSYIYPQVFVGENVLIGENTIIHSGVKIYKNSVIGKNCIIHSGTVIGSDGFGFNIDKDGKQKKVIHNGNVLIDDYGRNVKEWKTNKGIPVKHKSTAETISKLRKLGYV